MRIIPIYAITIERDVCRFVIRRYSQLVWRSFKLERSLFLQRRRIEETHESAAFVDHDQAACACRIVRVQECGERWNSRQGCRGEGDQQHASSRSNSAHEDAP